jgi:hypothetical protein
MLVWRKQAVAHNRTTEGRRCRKTGPCRPRSSTIASSPSARRRGRRGITREVERLDLRWVKVPSFFGHANWREKGGQHASRTGLDRQRSSTTAQRASGPGAGGKNEQRERRDASRHRNLLGQGCKLRKPGWLVAEPHGFASRPRDRFAVSVCANECPSVKENQGGTPLLPIS